MAFNCNLTLYENERYLNFCTFHGHVILTIIRFLESFGYLIALLWLVVHVILGHLLITIILYCYR